MKKVIIATLIIIFVLAGCNDDKPKLKCPIELDYITTIYGNKGINENSVTIHKHAIQVYPYNIVGFIPNKTKLQILEYIDLTKSGGIFRSFKINYNNKIGWISSYFTHGECWSSGMLSPL